MCTFRMQAMYYYIYIYRHIYIYTRVDPCIKCTRSKLDTGQGVLGLVAPEDLLSVCCLVLPLVLSSVVLSPLVSSCLGFSALVSSCVVCWASPGPFLGLPRASLGTHFAPCWAPWRPLGFLGPSWASPGSLLASPGAPWASSWAALGGSWPSLGPPLARSWTLLGCPWVLLRLCWALLGRSWQPKTTFHETFERLHFP